MNIPVIKYPLPQTLDASQCDIQFVFTNLTSKAWERLRLVLQRRADVFMYNTERTAAYAGFIITQDNARKIADLYLRIYRWKSVFVKIKDVDTEIMEDIAPWAYCWIMAHTYPVPDQQCLRKDFDPQLYTGITSWWDYIMEEHTWIEERLTLPCKNVDFRPDTKHPGTYKEQFAQCSRTKGCDRCPFYNINRFRAYVVNTDPEIENESKKQITVE